MYETAWSSNAYGAPRRQRAHGRISFEAALSDSKTRPMRIAESGPSRLRLPNTHGETLEAVIMNTGGGIACGDRFDIAVKASVGTRLVVTTPAAERCYKSDGPVSAIDVELSVESGAMLAWLPQETLFYNEARLRRRFEADIAMDARFLMYESVVFGRAAKGETIETGLFEDFWRIRRGGKLVYADTLRLAGPIASLLARPTIAKGARALATFLYVTPDAEAQLEEVRALLHGASCTAAASAWNGLLAVRFLADDVSALRGAAMGFLISFRGAPLPRVWHS